MAQRIEQLDGLRALAFLGVFTFHTTAIPYTWMGVDQFFVLSGYLITRNLIGLREAAPGRALAVFYYRRLLRIVAPYYLALLLVAIVRPYPLGEAPWYFGFASNIRDTIHPAIKGQLLTMWSIAVEEQFYLLWPFLVLLLPARRLPLAFVVAIVAAPLIRLALTPVSADAVYRLVVCRTDLLGFGALIAWLDLRDPEFLRRHATRFALAGGAAVILFAALATNPSFELEHNDALYNTVGYSLEAIAFTAILVLVRLSTSGPIYRALRFPPLEYLGRVSYMAYLVHVTCLDLAVRLTRSGPARIALALALTVAVASASWYLLEQPLQRLKDRVTVR